MSNQLIPEEQFQTVVPSEDGLLTVQSLNTESPSNNNLLQDYNIPIIGEVPILPFQVGTCFENIDETTLIKTTEELYIYLCEILIRFDSDPRYYQKEDYRFLVKTITNSLIYLYNTLPIGENTLQSILDALESKVDKLEGYGLSKNNLSDILKTAYDAAYTHSQTTHAPSDAEKNVNADWNATSGDAEILHKPSIPSITGLATELYVQGYAEPKFTKNTGFNLNLGTEAGTVLEGRTFGSAAAADTTAFDAAGAAAAITPTTLGLVIGTNVLAYRTFGSAANSNIGDFATSTQGATADTALAIAKGATVALSYWDYSSMVTYLNTAMFEDYNVGQSIYILTLDVPDIWISERAAEGVAYTYVSDQQLIDDINTSVDYLGNPNGKLLVGNFYISFLETAKITITPGGLIDSISFDGLEIAPIAKNVELSGVVAGHIKLILITDQSIDNFNISDYNVGDKIYSSDVVSIYEVNSDKTAWREIMLSAGSIYTYLYVNYIFKNGGLDPIATDSQLTNTVIDAEYVHTDNNYTDTDVLEVAKIADKVDKVTGKSLIDDTEIARLATVENYDDTDVLNSLDLKQTVFTGICQQQYLTENDIVIDNTALTLTIATVKNGTAISALNPICFYTDGSGIATKHVINAPVVFNFTDTTGVWYFYFNSAGVAVATQTPWSDFATIATVFRFYWNNTLAITDKCVIQAVEFHKNDISWTDHEWKHSQGTQWVSGFDISSNKLATGVPNADGRNSVIILSTGKNIDDNLEYTVTNAQAGTAKFTQDLGTALLPATSGKFICISNDSTGRLTKIPATAYPFLYNAASNLPEYLSATGVRTLVTANYFFVYYVYALQDPRYGETVKIKSAEVEFANVNNANAHSWEQLQVIFPTLRDNEIRLMYKIVFEHRSTYNLACKETVIRTIDDLRKQKITTTALAGGTLPATSITFAPVGTIASTNVQSAIEELDSEKAAIISQGDDATAPNNATFTIAPNTVKIITTELNGTSVPALATVIITPSIPTDLTRQNEATVVFKVGTSKPTNLAFTPSGASTFVWMDKAALSTATLQVSKTYTIVFFWESATVCQVYYAIKA